MNNNLIILIMLLLVSPAMAGTATITIFGTNASNAQSNLTNTGNQSVNVTTWNVNGIKTFRINVTNASDTITLVIANNSANQINELLVNGTSINGIQVNSSGWFNYTHTQGTGNVTFTIRPAVNQGGFNTIWAWIQYLTVVNQTTINNVQITNTSILNATSIQGNGSGIYSLNASNLTTGIILSSLYGTGIYAANVSNFNATVNATMDRNLSNATGIVPTASLGNGSGLYSLNASNITTGLMNGSLVGLGVNAANVSVNFAPTNLLQNTQFQVWTGQVYADLQANQQIKVGVAGTANTASWTWVNSINLSNRVVQFNYSSGDDSEAQVGDLVTFDNTPDVPCSYINPDGIKGSYEILTIVHGVNFTAKMPYGCQPSSGSGSLVNIIGVGDFVGHTDDAADSWKKSSAIKAWRDDWTANIRNGSVASIGIKISGNPQYVYQEIQDVATYKNKTVVFGTWVKQGVKGGAGTWRPYIYDGVTSTLGTNSIGAAGVWVWEEVSKTIADNATTLQFGIELNGNANDVYYLNQPIAAFGTYLGTGNYASQPGLFIPLVKFTPHSFFGSNVTFPTAADATGTYGFEFNPYSETNGVIGKHVKAINYQLEGKSTTFPGLFAVRNQESTPHIYSLIIPTLYINSTAYIQYGNGIMPLDNHRAWFYSTSSGIQFELTSIDINSVYLP